MPEQFTYDDLLLALAQEAYSGEHPIDISTGTTSAELGTSAFFDELAYGASGATTTAYHNTYLYLRRFSGLATAGGASTITLRTSMGDLGTANVLANFTIRITAGTSSGDTRTISSNTDASPTVVTVDSPWTATPTTTSFYEIYPSSSTEDRFVRTSKALSTGSFVTTTGEVTVAPAFTGNAGAALSIGIGGDFLFCKDNPNLLRNSINRILRNMRYPAYLPVTLIPDGAIEGSYTLGTTESFTEWWKIATPTSAAFSSTSYPFPFGRQYLDVVTGATATGKGVQSPTVAVDPDENLYVAALVQKTPATTETSTFNVILYDVTNSAALKTVTVSGQQPVIVYFQQALASTTEEVAIQVVGATASTVSFRVGPTFLWSGSKTRYAADTSSLERGTDVKGTATLHLGQTVETDVYHIGALEETNFGVERDDRANLINIVIPKSSYPTFLSVERRYPELTYDTDTTYAERDMVVQGAMYHIEMTRAAALAAGNPNLASWHRGRAREYASTYSSMLEGTGIKLVDVNQIPESRTAVRFA